jgi:putative sterol carrier protein
MTQQQRIQENKLQFFSHAWWQAWVDLWNNSDHQISLANLGKVEFQTSEEPVCRIFLLFDELGNAKIVEFNRAEIVFTATLKDWWLFVNGEYTATMGVLTRRIKISGNIAQVLPFSKAFNNMALVAQTMSNTIDT